MPCTRYSSRQSQAGNKERHATVVLIVRLGVVLTTLLLPFFCQAETDMISGRVVSLDREANQVVLEITTDDGNTREVTVQAESGLPPCAEPGATMQAWGSFNDDTGHAFAAHDLRGAGRRLGRDPTGVRSRLHRYHRSGGSTSTRTGGSRRPGSSRHRRGR